MQQKIEELQKQLEAAKNEHKLSTQNYQKVKTERDEFKRQRDDFERERDDFESKLKEKSSSQKSNRHSKQFWDDIATKCVQDPDFIKSLIKNKTITMSDVNDKKQTLLIIAASRGSYEVVQFCLNLGADVNHKDDYGKTALQNDSVEFYSDVEELLKFAELNANIGDRIRETAFVMDKQKGINENILSELRLIGKHNKQLFENTLLEIMVNIIDKKLAFSDHLLNLCFDINKNILKSELWMQIKKTCKQIIENGNKRDWYWMREYIVPSTIWYKIIDGKNDEIDTDESDDIKENTYKGEYLYYELLALTRKQEFIFKQKLESNINAEKNKNNKEWNKLISFDINNDKLTKLKEINDTSSTKMFTTNTEITNIRQDNISNGVQSLFTFNELTEKSSVTFNSHKFYDYNQYLPQIQLLAQIVDDEFHESVQQIFNIDKNTKIGIININDHDHHVNDDEKKYTDDGVIKYMRGPVKLMNRAKNKAENDYFDQKFPTTACVLDFNRCTLVFNEINTLLFALNLFSNKIKYYQSGNIIGIVRCKNSFKEYIKEIQYADIKFNILIKGIQNNIIGEVQFLLKQMVEFKNKNHSLYSIQRQEEFIKNSITKILPSLLNHNKQIWVASSSGNVDIFRKLMVHSNKTDKEIMIHDTTNNCNNQYSLLHRICEKGHLKAFEYLQDIAATDLFIKHLCEHKWGFGSTPISAAISNGQLLIVKKICTNSHIQKRYKSNDSELFKLIHGLFQASPNKDLIDLVLSQFEISNTKIEQFIIKDKYIINDIITWNHSSFNVLQKLISIIGDKAFIDGVFKAPLTHFEFKDKWKNVDEQTFSLIGFLFQKCKNEETIDFILNKLNISKETVIKSMDFKWENNTIIGATAFHNQLNILTKLASIIGQKHFIHYIFVSNKSNQNALEQAIEMKKLSIVKYLMSYKAIKQKCLNDKEILWRIVYWTNYQSSPAMVEYVVNELKLNEKILKGLQAYKCPNSFDYDKWGDIMGWHKYWERTISDDAINRLLNRK